MRKGTSRVTGRGHVFEAVESCVTLKEAVIQGIHRLAEQFQEVGDPNGEAHLRAWRVLRRAFPFSRLDELQTNQFRQVIAFLGEQIDCPRYRMIKGNLQRDRETGDARITYKRMMEVKERE